MAADKQPGGTSAGRGVLYIAFAKFYFMFAGLVVQFRMPGILSRSEFGAFSLVASMASMFNNVVVTGTIQTVSRFSAQEPGKARRVQQAGLRMHLRLGLLISIVFIAATPLVSLFFYDMSKMVPLMLCGVILGSYSFYAVFVGTANGLHQFHKQATFDISSATLRVVGMLGMAMAGLGVVGVISGWVAAVLVVFCFSIVWVGLPGRIPAEDRLPLRPLITYFVGVAVYLALFNGLMFADTFLIKRLTTEYFQDHAVSNIVAGLASLPWGADITGYHYDPSVLADVQNAYYAAVQNLARLSYQAIIAATFVVFPLVSRSTFTDDQDTTRRYIQVTSRYSLMFALAIAVVLAANPAEMLGLIYASDYAQRGGPPLVFLAFGNVAFSILAINGTILNGAGRTRDAVLVAVISLAIAIVGNWIAIPIAAESGHALEAAAIVTSCAMLVGAIGSALLVHRRLGASVPVLSLVRIAIATACAWMTGRFLGFHGKLMALVEACIVGGVFLVVLVASRELGARDLAAIKAVRKSRSSGGGEP